VFAWEEQSPALPFFLPSIQRARCWALQGVSHANGAKTPKTGVRHERKYVVPGNWNDDPDAA